MNIVSVSTDAIARAAADKFNSFILNQATLILLSGGSSLELLDLLQTDSFGSHVTIGMLDERFSTDPRINNFSQFAESRFYTKALQKDARFIDTKVQAGDTLDIYASRFESTLRDWKERNKAGKVIATIGMGPDGHTSGIFPYPEDPEQFSRLFEGNEWVAGYDVGEKNEHNLRVTVTITFLRTQVDHSISYVKGANKIPAIQRVVAEQGTLAETPARVLRELRDETIFTDFALDGK